MKMQFPSSTDQWLLRLCWLHACKKEQKWHALAEAGIGKKNFVPSVRFILIGSSLKAPQVYPRQGHQMAAETEHHQTPIHKCFHKFCNGWYTVFTKSLFAQKFIFCVCVWSPREAGHVVKGETRVYWGWWDLSDKGLTTWVKQHKYLLHYLNPCHGA